MTSKSSATAQLSVGELYSDRKWLLPSASTSSSQSWTISLAFSGKTAHIKCHNCSFRKIDAETKSRCICRAHLPKVVSVSVHTKLICHLPNLIALDTNMGISPACNNGVDKYLMQQLSSHKSTTRDCSSLVDHQSILSTQMC